MFWAVDYTPRKCKMYIFLSYRFKPDLEQSIWNEIKEPSEMLRSSRMYNLEQKSNEPTRVKIKFRANPSPTDCRWKITNDEQDCQQSIVNGVMEGEYVVYLNAKLEDRITLEVSNNLGVSNFISKPKDSTTSKLSAGTNSAAFLVPSLFVILVIALGLFIFKRRQQRKIFRNPDLTVENQILENQILENLNESCRCNQQKSELPPPSYSTLNVNENNETSDQVFVENSSVQPSDINSEVKPDEELESEEKRLSAYSSFLRSRSREDIGPSKSFRLTLFKSGDYDP